MNGSSMFERC